MHDDFYSLIAGCISLLPVAFPMAHDQLALSLNAVAKVGDSLAMPLTKYNSELTSVD